MNKRVFCFCFIILVVIGNGFAQQLKVAKLRNGMTVYIWEDLSKPDVYGNLICRVGSVDDPEDLTGLAHYLEHLMFKGTETLGSLDWEKEKPVYEAIIAKYDLLANEKDEGKRKILSNEINELTIQAAQYANGDEFSRLIEEIGGKGLNAGTSYDFTMYHNSFPPNHLAKWLELYSERLINPVFRTFQPELETVYEEYNRMQDNRMMRFSSFMTASLYDSHPYGRSIIGLGEHLKNPRLSRLIDFYNTWYVPENMALVLVGNVSFDTAFPLIRDSFSKLAKRPLPERTAYPVKPIEGRLEKSAKLLPYPMVVMGFNGVSVSSEENLGVRIMCDILTNESQTGLLDKYVLDGGVSGVSASLDSRRDQGRILVSGVPFYDPNQRLWYSHKSVESIILKEIENLKQGNFEDWLFESIKESMLCSHILKLESNNGKMNELLDVFVYGKELSQVVDYVDGVKKISKETVIALANRYLQSDYCVLKISEGKNTTNEKIKKPDTKPVEPRSGVSSTYAEWLRGIDEKTPELTFCDFNTVREIQVNDQSRLFYTHNPENDIYTLTLKYGVGLRDIPDLDKAAMLMSSAGILGQMKPIEFKQELGRINARCSYTVNNDYLTIKMEGDESTLEEACLLLTRQILMPALDEKQSQQLLGSIYSGRQIEKSEISSQEAALIGYALYKDKSTYIDRTPIRKLFGYSVGDYTSKFQQATDYAAEVHYVGSRSFEEVKDILSKNLPLKAKERESVSPQVKPFDISDKNTVYFYPNTEAKQSKIYFLIEGGPFLKENMVSVSAFNSYFSRLVYSEIREKRSMAYESWGVLQMPILSGHNLLLQCFVGTQADKTLEALDVFTRLLTELPVETDRMDAVKMNLQERLLTDKPSFRTASQVFQNWKRMGYEEDPAKISQSQIETLSFDQIQSVYNANIKGKPWSIVIVGNPKSFDSKALQNYGEVVRMNEKRIFSEN